jgi:uncharacterized damage-inducible protein DinB
MPRIPIPGADEHAPYYGKYVAQLPGGDVLHLLRVNAALTAQLLAATDESRGSFRYAEGKWSVKEVVGHLCDAERVFAYRALRFGRSDLTELPGFDENLYVPAGRFDRRTLADLAAEFAIVRTATLALFNGFDDESLLRRGVASGQPVSVRALAAIIAGHEIHHVGLLRERYGLTG